MTPELKTIVYRGGLLKFRVPADWCEEYIPDGGADFFPENAASPTFSVQTMSMNAPDAWSADRARHVLEIIMRPQGAPNDQHTEFDRSTPEQLPNGHAFSRGSYTATETRDSETRQLFIVCWYVAKAEQSKHVLLANFTYTIFEEEKDDERFQAEIELLDNEVRACFFHGDDSPLGEEARPKPGLLQRFKSLLKP